MDKSKSNGGKDLITNRNVMPARSNKRTCKIPRKKYPVPSIRHKNCGIAKRADSEEQVSRILDRMNHLKKYSAEESDDDNLFVQWTDDISDTLSGLWCTGTFLKLLISSALSGRAKRWFDSTTEGIDDHLIRTYTLEKFLALLSGEFDGAKFIRRERFTELLKLTIDSETSLEKFAKISGLLTPYYLSSSAALDLFLTKLEPRLQKQLEDAVFPMTLDIALLIIACEFARGTSKPRKDRNVKNGKNGNDNNKNKNNINTTSALKKKNTGKRYKTQSINEICYSTAEGSDVKENTDGKTQEMPHPKRRKENEARTRHSLAISELKEMLPLGQTLVPNNRQTNPGNPLDSFMPLVSNKPRNSVLNTIPTLDNNGLSSGARTVDLTNDTVQNTEHQATTHKKPIDNLPLSMSRKSCKYNAEVPDRSLKVIYGGGQQISDRSHTMDTFSHSGSSILNQPAWQDIKINQIEDIDSSNPFTRNTNRKILDNSRSLKDPITSVKANEPSCSIDIEKPRSIRKEIKDSRPLTQRIYPLHNFAVRTRNAYFNDRPSNYTSAHGIRPLYLTNNNGCSSRPHNGKSTTEIDVTSAYVVAQEKTPLHREKVEGNDRTFNTVTNPFLANIMNKAEQSSYYT